MRKNILGILAFVMAFVMIGSVSAAVTFSNPGEGQSYAGTLNVSWANPDSDSTYTLQYRAGSCDEGSWTDLTSMTGQIPSNYAWNTKTGSKAVVDGLYCLRLRVGGVTGAISGLFTIDNHAPLVDIHETTVPYPGADEKSNPVRVLIDYGDYGNVDTTPTCKINWNDGNISNCPATGVNSDHQYGDNGNYKVIVTVSDDAGNSASDFVTVSVKNVDPNVSKITTDLTPGRNDVALGQAVTFYAIAGDVDADLEAGLTCEWTFDGSTVKTTTADDDGNCEIKYTWTHASTHTVDLTVEDKDGGSVDAEQYTIEVLAPEHMTPMQQVVANSQFEFHLDATWASTSTNFKTSFTGEITCEKVSGPTSMTSVVGTTAGECSIDWTPTIEDKGEHSVIIRVNKSTSYSYYSFDVTVYSWGIVLHEGWNLISVPYVPTDSNIEAVFADILPNIVYESDSSSVLQYDAVKDKWNKAKPTSSHTGFTGTLDKVVPGYGYWVKMDKEDTLYGIEENFNPGQVLMPSVELATESWNLVGRYGVNPAPLNIGIAFESLEDHYYSTVYEFNGVNYVSSDDTIDSGKGYWIRTKMVEGFDTVTYEPISYYFN